MAKPETEKTEHIDSERNPFDAILKKDYATIRDFYADRLREVEIEKETIIAKTPNDKEALASMNKKHLRALKLFNTWRDRAEKQTKGEK